MTVFSSQLQAEIKCCQHLSNQYLLRHLTFQPEIIGGNGGRLPQILLHLQNITLCSLKIRDTS